MTERVWAEWRNRVAAEYRSAAMTAAVLHGAIAAGFPPELLHTALRIVRDELDHAELSHQCLTALGGPDAPIPLSAATLWPTAAADPLGDLVDRVVRDFCLGETFAVPLFDAMRRHATHPAVVPVVVRVLQDEAIHRQFGWDALDVLLSLDPARVRPRVQASVPALLAAFRDAYAPDGSADPLTDEERSAGLLDLDDYRRCFGETLRDDVVPRFARRGIVTGS